MTPTVSYFLDHYCCTLNALIAPSRSGRPTNILCLPSHQTSHLEYIICSNHLSQIIHQTSATTHCLPTASTRHVCGFACKPERNAKNANRDVTYAWHWWSTSSSYSLHSLTHPLIHPPIRLQSNQIRGGLSNTSTFNKQMNFNSHNHEGGESRGQSATQKCHANACVVCGDTSRHHKYHFSSRNTLSTLARLHPSNVHTPSNGDDSIQSIPIASTTNWGHVTTPKLATTTHRKTYVLFLSTLVFSPPFVFSYPLHIQDGGSSHFRRFYNATFDCRTYFFLSRYAYTLSFNPKLNMLLTATPSQPTVGLWLHLPWQVAQVVENLWRWYAFWVWRDPTKYRLFNFCVDNKDAARCGTLQLPSVK